MSKKPSKPHLANHTPPDSDGKKSSFKKDVLVALITAATTIVATAVTAFITTDWFKDKIGLKSSDIVVRRMVVYARILAFSDRHLEEKPICEKEVGLRASAIRNNLPIYDEGLYLHAYYLSPHVPSRMFLKAHSSGLVDLTPVIPPTGHFVPEQYEKTNGSEIECQVDVDGLNYVLATYHYYNGYQYNAQKKRYESDGGCHIIYQTDEVTVAFDFSSLPYERLLKQDPRLYIRKPGSDIDEQVAATYLEGILVSGPISKPPIGSRIFCQWKWKNDPH